MKMRLFLLATIILLPAVPAIAAKGDVAAGQQKAQLCANCHGATGISAMAGVPSLAGQQDQFLQWQLVFFRSGRRANPVMSAFAANLDDADIRNLGAYYASLPANTAIAGKTTNTAAAAKAAETPAPDKTADTDLSTKGQTIVAEHHCANCHTDSFRGERAAASIADQREDYLVKALADYRSAARPSVGVAAMTEAASGLNDDEIAAIAHYLATYQPAGQ